MQSSLNDFRELGLVVPPSRADPRAVPEDYFTFMAVSGPATGSRISLRCRGRCRNDSNAMTRDKKAVSAHSGGAAIRARERLRWPLAKDLEIVLRKVAQ